MPRRHAAGARGEGAHTRVSWRAVTGSEPAARRGVPTAQWGAPAWEALRGGPGGHRPGRRRALPARTRERSACASGPWEGAGIGSPSPRGRGVRAQGPQLPVDAVWESPARASAMPGKGCRAGCCSALSFAVRLGSTRTPIRTALSDAGSREK